MMTMKDREYITDWISNRKQSENREVQCMRILPCEVRLRQWHVLGLLKRVALITIKREAFAVKIVISNVKN